MSVVKTLAGEPSHKHRTLKDVGTITKANGKISKAEDTGAVEVTHINMQTSNDKTATRYKTKIFKNIRQAIKELNLIKSGKLKARNAEDLFNKTI